jgi:glycosyltransferase involved in cell wall biosynthesis
VTVFTLDHGRLPYDHDSADYRIIRLHTPLRYGDAGMVPQLLWRLKGFAAVHLHYPFYGGAEYVYLAALLRGQRYLLTCHMDVRGNTLLKRLILGGYEPLLAKQIIRRAAAVGALSIEHLLSTDAARFVDWDKVVELPNGVDAELFCPGGKDRRLMARYGIDGKTVVLFVGNLQPFKRLDLVIDALARIDRPDVVLLVVGGGYGEEGYRSRVRELRLDNRVIFAGPQSPSGDLPAHYRLGDFLVLPSTHSEAFPLVVLEAMASGLPVIVSALPGPSGLVDQERDGLIARTGDLQDLVRNMELLVTQADKRREMGAAARAKVLERYRWEKIGERLESVLKKISE